MLRYTLQVPDAMQGPSIERSSREKDGEVDREHVGIEFSYKLYSRNWMMPSVSILR